MRGAQADWGTSSDQSLAAASAGESENNFRNYHISFLFSGGKEFFFYLNKLYRLDCFQISPGDLQIIITK